MIVKSEIKNLKEEHVKLKDESVESNNPYLPKLYIYICYVHWLQRFSKDIFISFIIETL